MARDLQKAGRKLVRGSCARRTLAGKEELRVQLRAPAARACRRVCLIRGAGWCTAGRRPPLPARRCCNRVRCGGGRYAPTAVLPAGPGVSRCRLWDEEFADASSSLGLCTIEGGFQRIANRCAQADACEAYVRLPRGVCELITKAAGRLVHAGFYTVVAEEAYDDFGVEVAVLHQAGHVLVLFVRHFGHGGVEFGERCHHAATQRRR